MAKEFRKPHGREKESKALKRISARNGEKMGRIYLKDNKAEVNSLPSLKSMTLILLAREEQLTSLESMWIIRDPGGMAVGYFV